MTFIEKLGDGWVDIDVALYHLGTRLGVMSGSFLENKAVLWCSNPVNDLLFEVVEKLVDAGFLELGEDIDKVRKR